LIISIYEKEAEDNILSDKINSTIIKGRLTVDGKYKIIFCSIKIYEKCHKNPGKRGKRKRIIINRSRLVYNLNIVIIIVLFTLKDFVYFLKTQQIFILYSFLFRIQKTSTNILMLWLKLLSRALN
jgi:hypothetical protein